MEKYKVLIKPSAVKELGDIPKRDLQNLTKRISALADNPRPFGVEKLSGQERYRLRQGNYRIVYGIDDSQKMIEVVMVAHRREVYR